MHRGLAASGGRMAVTPGPAREFRGHLCSLPGPEKGCPDFLMVISI